MTMLSSRCPRGGLFLAPREWASLFARARRVSARLPSDFLLLAQKKVTKEEGPNTSPFEWLASATRLLQRLWLENIQRTTLAATSLMFSRSISLRLDPAGPRRGGVQRSEPVATGRAAAKAKPVAAQPLGFSVPLLVQRPMQSACSRSGQAKWAGVRALCFGDFHLGPQMKVTRQPGRNPAGCNAVQNPKREARNPAGYLKGSPP